MSASAQEERDGAVLQEGGEQRGCGACGGRDGGDERGGAKEEIDGECF